MKSTPFYYNMMPLGVQTGQVLFPGQCTVSTFMDLLWYCEWLNMCTNKCGCFGYKQVSCYSFRCLSGSFFFDNRKKHMTTVCSSFSSNIKIINSNVHLPALHFLDVFCFRGKSTSQKTATSTDPPSTHGVPPCVRIVNSGQAPSTKLDRHSPSLVMPRCCWV